MYPHGQTITVRRATKVEDAYGDLVPAVWSDLQIYEGCAVWPTASTEINDNRSATITSMEMVLPHGADVTSADRLVWDGKTYEVIGEPFDWVSPFTGWAPGVQVTVQKVTG